MQTFENKKEISILELVDLFRRNFNIILWTVVISLTATLALSTFSYVLDKDVINYSLSTNISVNGDDIGVEIVTLISNSLSHPSILEQAQSRLGLSTSDYKIVSRSGSNPEILQLTVIGSDSSKLALLSNELIFLGKALIEDALPTLELRKLEISSPTVLPHSTKSNVNWILNSVFGVVLGVLISLFYIFVVFFMSPTIILDNELETLFDTKILGRFVDKPRKQTIRKFFEVR